MKKWEKVILTFSLTIFASAIGYLLIRKELESDHSKAHNVVRYLRDLIGSSPLATNKINNASNEQKILTSKNCGIHMHQFDRIVMGMSYGEVLDILQCQGILTLEVEAIGQKVNHYKWSYISKGGAVPAGEVRMEFLEDKLTTKSKHNRNRFPTNCFMTDKKFMQVNIGMSYTEVKDIMGCDGFESDIMQMGKVTVGTYIWDTAFGGIGMFEFKNGLITSRTRN